PECAFSQNCSTGGEETGVGSTGEGPNPPFTTPVSDQLTSNSQLSSLPGRLPSAAMSSRYTVGPTETERCIESLLAVFQRYAGKEGDSKTLSKKEFRIFMDTELASFTKNQKDPGVVDRMMKKLDINSDGQLDFAEFLNLIGGLAVAVHEMASAPAGGAPRRLINQTQFKPKCLLTASMQPIDPEKRSRAGKMSKLRWLREPPASGAVYLPRFLQGEKLGTAIQFGDDLVPQGGLFPIAGLNWSRLLPRDSKSLERKGFPDGIEASRPFRCDPKKALLCNPAWLRFCKHEGAECNDLLKNNVSKAKSADTVQSIQSRRSGANAPNSTLERWQADSVCLLEIPAKMPSQLEHAMETVMFTFHKFAGDKNYLTKEDLRVLMEKEVPGYMENQKDPMAIDRIMKNLEECRDGKISFEGYLSLFAGLTNGCNEYYIKKMKPTGKKF
ncbi:hypothetical protein L345_13731, partial [Ophiophagus hannah]